MDTKKLVLSALFIAISFIGANINLMGSIAFDSLPGFLAALILGPWYGAAIGLLGHLFTALTSGFPLSLPIHLVIAVSMAITMLCFGFSYRMLKEKVSEAANLIITGAIGVLLNAPGSLALSMSVMAVMIGREAALGLLVLLPMLTFASAANIILAFAVFKSLARWGKFR